MECAHIIAEASGGEPSLDNCIPVCFDCHADIGHYNTSHPRGNKFTTEELKEHRDRWFAKVAGTAHAVLPDTIDVDRKVFASIRAALPSQAGIKFLRQNNFAGFSFQSSEYHDIKNFWREREAPENEFLDSDLESLRASFIDAIGIFINVIGTNMFPVNGNEGWFSVPPEWEDEQPERFFRVVEEIHKTAAEVCIRYDELIRTARRRLNVA